MRISKADAADAEHKRIGRHYVLKLYSRGLAESSAKWWAFDRDENETIEPASRTSLGKSLDSKSSTY